MERHAYTEKPVSHNVWEGQKLADGQAKYGTVIQHGFQRRSETCWAEAFAWLKEGNFGKLTLARGFCYKPRKSIGKGRDSGRGSEDGKLRSVVWAAESATDTPQTVSLRLALAVTVWQRRSWQPGPTSA